MNDCNIFKYLFWGLVSILLLALLGMVDLANFLSTRPFLYTLYKNLNSISSVLNNLLPLLVILILFLILLSSKWIFRIERLSIGGINILFNHPDKILKQQLLNYFATKRTLFYIDPEKDNFYETFNSYYQVYTFIRDELKTYSPKHAANSVLYQESEKILSSLNFFLTTHQNNYRRWYEYITTSSQCLSSNYDQDISELQQTYRHYTELIADFEALNTKFRQYGDLIDVNYLKWRD